MTEENRDVREIIREEPLRRRQILKALGDGQMTVPEIAEAICRADQRDDVLGDGYAQVPLARGGRRRDRRRFLPLSGHREAGILMTIVQPGLVDEVRQDASFNASACMNCGVCTAICPMGLDHLPRRSSATCCSA